MAQSLLQFNPARIRSYIFRIPLCTRLILFVIFTFWIASLYVPWLRQWAALVPSQVNLGTMYRLNTYPFSHLGFIHTILNVLALTQLLERFEAEHGTLVTLILFTGPFSTLPGALYILIERVLLRHDTPVQGASIWIFLLLTSSTLLLSRTHPAFSLSPSPSVSLSIPTWSTPLLLILAIHFLVPNTSLIGHLCGAAVGYLWGLGWIRFLVPPEKILRYVEGKLNLLGRLPHYVSVDQKTYGRYGVLPSMAEEGSAGVGMGFLGRGQRVGV